ncbi:MAG: hypothetical protein NVSMB55_28270 [Mycobacteriales bacterium]
MLAVDLGWHAVTAAKELRTIQAQLPALRAAAAAGDDTRVQVLTTEVAREAHQARRATAGPVWAAASHVPWLGPSFAVGADATHAVDQLAAGVLPAASQILAQWRHAPRADLYGLRTLARGAPDLDRCWRITAVVQSRLQAGGSAGLLPSVARGRRRLIAQVVQLGSLLRTAAGTAWVAPAMLGSAGTRHYFVAFQNNAEARGTGGLVGAYAILTADQQGVRFTTVGSDRDLESLPPPRLDLGAQYRRLYGPDSAAWQNANLSAHFPYAAQLWLDMWYRRTGQRLDGAVATDPVALSYLLEATGPLRLGGSTVVSSRDVVAQTEQIAYVRFAQQNLVRKQFLLTVAKAVVARLLGAGRPSVQAILPALARAAKERRLDVWSAHPGEQRALMGTAVAGEVPATLQPFAFLVVNNSGGNKIDFYLQRKLRYELASCDSGRRRTRVVVTLLNAAPPGALPAVVDGRLDLAAGAVRAGTSALLVSVLLTSGAAPTSVVLDGRPVEAVQGWERGHPVVVVRVELARGQRRQLALQLMEPARNLPILVPVQPLVHEQHTVIGAARCQPAQLLTATG